MDPGEPPRPRHHHHARRGQAARRDGAVQREVRRRRPHGRGRGRVVLTRAVRRHPRPRHRGDRPVPDRHRDLERRQRPAHRGDHRPRGDRPLPRARPRADRRGRAPARAAGTGPRTRWTELSERVRELERAARRRRRAATARSTSTRSSPARDPVGRRERSSPPRSRSPTGRRCWQLADRLKGKLGDAAIVLGAAGEGRVDLVASVAPALVARGVRAGEIVKVAAREVGGGGGGRDTLARAGGQDPASCPAAINAARTAIEAALRASETVRVLALDYGRARCGCAVSDPTGALATPLEPIAGARVAPRPGAAARPRRRAGRRAGGRRPAAVAVGRRLRSDHRGPRVRRAAGAARCRSRSSSTTSASRRGWPSARPAAPARTRGRPRTCWRAGWPAGARRRSPMADGAAQRRGARGGAARARGRAPRDRAGVFNDRELEPSAGRATPAGPRAAAARRHGAHRARADEPTSSRRARTPDERRLARRQRRGLGGAADRRGAVGHAPDQPARAARAPPAEGRGPSPPPRAAGRRRGTRGAVGSARSSRSSWPGRSSGSWSSCSSRWDLSARQRHRRHPAPLEHQADRRRCSSATASSPTASSSSCARRLAASAATCDRAPITSSRG